MKIMAYHSSAIARAKTPHTVNSTKNNLEGKKKISLALKRRAQSLIDNNSIDRETRAVIRYGLEINDPWLAELVRRADVGETILDNMNVQQPSQNYSDDAHEERIETLAEIICRAGDEPAMKSAALLVLMSILENATHPKALANTAKHLAFTRCGELNFCGMVDAQIAVCEGELLAGNRLMP
jgi:hypothetical protein